LSYVIFALASAFLSTTLGRPNLGRLRKNPMWRVDKQTEFLLYASILISIALCLFMVKRLTTDIPLYALLKGDIESAAILRTQNKVNYGGVVYSIIAPYFTVYTAILAFVVYRVTKKTKHRFAMLLTMIITVLFLLHTTEK